MRKLVLTIATLGICFQGIAQDKYVVSALTSINSRNYDEAKEDIDKAMSNPETKEKPKALFAKAQIYMMLQSIDKYKASNPYREGAQALFKLVELKPDYEKATVDQLLLGTALLSFNDGVKAYNDKDYTKCAELMRNVVKIHDMNGGKRFATHPMVKTFDTAAADANLSIANSALAMNNYDEAIPLLVKVKNNGLRKSPSLYELLIRAYNSQKNSAEAFATIQEARAAFPDDVNLRNYELNYYIQSGKQDELIKKLEDAAAKEPNNADIQFNIATTYLGMAIPKDKPKPANSAELSAKSEEAFSKTLKLAPENAVFNYNFGALFFNQASDVNEQMNNITGSSAADQKKYDELKAKRDGLFGKSLPYFEKANSVLGAQNDLKAEDTKTYRATLQALNKIYATQSKMDKATEMNKKLESLK